MARTVRDFDIQVKSEKYKVVADCGIAEVECYNNYDDTFTERDYYKIYMKPILKIRQSKGIYRLYI